MQIGQGIFASNQSSEYEWKSFKKQVLLGLRVAISDHQIHDYNDAGRKASATLLYNRNGECWEFIENNRSSPAYKHRPVKPVSKNLL